jgi:hypothetical protein
MALEGDFHDLPDGTCRLDLSDGSSTMMSGRGPDAHVLWQRTADGTEFSDFQGDKPGHVQFPDGKSGDYNYMNDGQVELSMSDGSETVLSGSGPDAHVVSQVTPEGDCYTDFDLNGNPGHVVFH